MVLVPVKNVHLGFKFQSYGMGGNETINPPVVHSKRNSVPQLSFRLLFSSQGFVGIDGKGKTLIADSYVYSHARRGTRTVAGMGRVDKPLLL